MENLKSRFFSDDANQSLGDKAISKSLSKTYNTSSLKDNFFDDDKDLTTITGSNNVIPVAKNDDNSIKVTFDNIYQNNDLAEVAKDFYYFRDQQKFKDNKEAIDYYINDRTWKQANVVSIGREYSYITGEDIKKDQLQWLVMFLYTNL